MATTQPPAKKRKYLPKSLSVTGQDTDHSRLYFTDPFKVVLGSGVWNKTYIIHKEILTTSSGFFKAACSKQWKEGKEKVIPLPEERPKTFNIYLQLLYTGEVVASDEQPPFSATVADEISRSLVDTYLLADVLVDVRSKNAIMDAFIQHAHRSRDYPFEYIDRVYDKTTAASPMRRVFVDLTAANDDMKFQDETIPDLPQEFVADLSLRLLALNKAGKRPQDPASAPKCTYHEHDEENPKCS